jgi:hypothetical protein
MILQMMSRMAYNSNDFFTPHEMEEGMGQSMDLVVCLGHIDYNVSSTQGLFKSLTNFMF